MSRAASDLSCGGCGLAVALASRLHIPQEEGGAALGSGCSSQGVHCCIVGLLSDGRGLARRREADAHDGASVGAPREM